MSDIISFHIGEAPPKRLDKAIARDVPEQAHLSRSRLTKLLEEGMVKVNGTVPEAKAKVREGDLVEITVEIALDVETLPEAIPLTILHEDDDVLVVEKPAGMVVHPAPGSPTGTLVNGLLHHFDGKLSGVGGEKRPGIVHRIDKDTSGLLVVAKSDAAHHGLAKQFEKHTVHRRYLAVCYGVFDSSDPRIRGLRGASFEPGNILKITTQLARHRTDRQRQAVCFSNGRHAITRARIMEDLGAASLIECWLETGRTHQIRVHLSHCGHGLIGDPTYGGKRKIPKTQSGIEEAGAFPRQALHAAELGFIHPVTGAQMMFSSPLPDDMQALIEALRP